MNVFMLTAIRSGSTYLLHLLRDTGLFFYPDRHHAHPSLTLQYEIQEFFAPNYIIDPWSIGKCSKTKEECIKYLRYKLSFMKREPCLFKVLMEQYKEYLLDMNDRQLIESMIPDLKYIWLERSDIIARTVSAYLLFHTKKDHIYNQHEYDKYMDRAVHIDAKRLLDVYKNHVKRCDWGQFLHGTNYLKIEYEDLVARPTDNLAKCLDFLGYSYDLKELQKIVDRQPKFKTERPESKLWIEKLRKILRQGMM